MNNMAHQLAVKHGTQLVKEGVAVGLSWTDIAMACETVIAIAVFAAADLSATPDRERFSTEIIEVMTERAHGRVVALLRGEEYNG